MFRNAEQNLMRVISSVGLLVMLAAHERVLPEAASTRPDVRVAQSDAGLSQTGDSQAGAPGERDDHSRPAPPSLHATLPDVLTTRRAGGFRAEDERYEARRLISLSSAELCGDVPPPAEASGDWLAMIARLSCRADCWRADLPTRSSAPPPAVAMTPIAPTGPPALRA